MAIVMKGNYGHGSRQVKQHVWNQHLMRAVPEPFKRNTYPCVARTRISDTTIELVPDIEVFEPQVLGETPMHA